MATQVAAPASGYPVRYDVEYPGRISRLLNLPLIIKPILAIPHLLIVYALFQVSYAIAVVAFFAILFTRRYPRGLFNLVVNTYRWNANVGAYVGWLRDEYPAFNWEAGKYPVTFEVQYPDRFNRWLPLVKWLLAVPHYIVLLPVAFVTFFAYFIAWFAILFTGRYPRPLFDFIVGFTRWGNRVQAYVYLLTDAYPPFSLK